MTHDAELLLINAPVGRHFAQLHRNPEARMRAVSLFVEQGLQRGNGVVVISSTRDAELLFHHLRRRSFDPVELRRRGQLALHDASTTLGQIMRGDLPDWPAFRRIVGGILENTQGFGQSTARVYGDMVDILWQEGRVQSAIALEDCWNEIARLYPFSLFCSYLLDGLDEKTWVAPLDEIGRTHSEIIVTEEDTKYGEVLATAMRDVFGVSASQMVQDAGLPGMGERRLPSAEQTVLWIMRNESAKLGDVLAQARRYLRDTLPTAPPS